MKMIQAIAIFLAMSATFAVAGDEIIFKKLKTAPDSITEEFFEIGVLPTVKVDGDLIQRIILEYEEGKSRARVGVFFKNTKSGDLPPIFTIRFYNPYGILMGGIRAPEDPKAPERLIKPGSEESEAFHPKITRLDTLFRHTEITEYPSDFFRIGWLSISDTNTKKSNKAEMATPRKPSD